MFEPIQPPLTVVNANNVELQVIATLAAALAGLAMPVTVDPDGPESGGGLQPLPVHTLAFTDGVPWVPEVRLADWLQSLPPASNHAWCALIRRRSDTMRMHAMPALRGETDRLHLGVFIVVTEQTDERPSWERSLRLLLDLTNRARNLIASRIDELVGSGLLAEGSGRPPLTWEGRIEWPSRLEGRGMLGEGVGFSVECWVVPGVRGR